MNETKMSTEAQQKYAFSLIIKFYKPKRDKHFPYYKQNFISDVIKAVLPDASSHGLSSLTSSEISEIINYANSGLLADKVKAINQSN
jgi:hypothetical protein